MLPAPECLQEDLPPKAKIRDHRAEPENQLWVLAGGEAEP